jgi:hypothetical protein
MTGTPAGTNGADGSRVYGGWQPERAGFVGRLSLLGFVLTGTAVVVLLVPVYRGDWAGLLVSAPIAVGLVGVAVVRVAGMAADRWLLHAVRHTWNTLRKRTVFTSGVFAPTRRGDPGQVQPMDLPGTLACLRFLDAPTGTGSSVAVVHDRLAGSYTLVARVAPPGLALADHARRDHRVAGWGGFLAGLCVQGGAIARVTVTQRALPDDGTALACWVADHTTPDAPEVAVRNLAELLGGAGPAGNARDTYLSLTLDATRARTKIRAAGGGDTAACAVLVREYAALRPALAAADLRVLEVLSPRRLAEVVRTGYDPDATEHLAARRTPGSPLPAGVAVDLAGPAAAVAGWGVYRHDGACTVTYQVRDWPRSLVYPTVLAPLLKPTDTARRSLALVCEPLGPRRAERELSVDRTRRQTLIGLRSRTGRVASVEEHRDLGHADAQDAARAAGHGIVRFTGLVAVTVTQHDDLAGACAELEADAAMARVELRRLWGAQDTGFAASCLPLGQGLPGRRLPL